jgi:hypothetical protein
MNTLLFLVVIVLSGLSPKAQAIGGLGRGGGGSPRSDAKQKTPTWPGIYTCVQCLPDANQSPETNTATPDKPPPGCWAYQINVSKDDSDLSAILQEKTHDKTVTIKTTVTKFESQLDLLYVETIGEPPPQPFKSGDCLVTLTLRDSDYFLRFKGLPSQVKDQSAVTCEKSGKAHSQSKRPTKKG